MISSEDFEKEDAQLKRMFDNISTTIIFISQALSHFEAYSFTELSSGQEMIVKNEIFPFFTMSAQFFMVVQFCKLFENYKTDIEGDSSLPKLNNLLQRKYPNDFKDHSKNTNIIKEIKASLIYNHVHSLRNKTYGHSENHSLNTPIRFVYLNENQIKEFRDIFLKAIEIFKNCMHLYGICEKVKKLARFPARSFFCDANLTRKDFK